MNDRLVLTDDLLRRALEQRMAHSPSPLLLGRIVTGAATAAQDRTPRGWLLRRIPAAAGADRPWVLVRVLAGVTAALVVTVLVALSIDTVPGPGATPSPLPSPTPPIVPAPTPIAVDVGGHQGLRLPLGFDTAPIDLIFADGSIWIANIHADDVRRFDPATMAELARIPVPAGQGPAWLTATDGAVWASNQLGGGLDHIDTASNTFTGVVGTGPTCGAPVQAFGSIWQSACDAGIFLRIDPVTRVAETIPAQGHGFLVLAGGRLLTTSADGFAELDPEAHTFEPLAFNVEDRGQVFSSDGDSLWVSSVSGLLRIDPAGGEILATFPYGAASSVTFADGTGWVSIPFVGVVEIDLATNTVVQTIPLNVTNPVVAREAAGALWVTDFDNSALWRLEP